jgi:hypothetical protein
VSPLSDSTEVVLSERSRHGCSDVWQRVADHRAGILIEDQAWPKSCGHVKNKVVVSREEAMARVQAAADARAEGADLLIVARTDARQVCLWCMMLLEGNKRIGHISGNPSFTRRKWMMMLLAL